MQEYREIGIEDLVEVTLNNDDDFLKIRETLFLLQ